MKIFALGLGALAAVVLLSGCATDDGYYGGSYYGEGYNDGGYNNGGAYGGYYDNRASRDRYNRDRYRNYNGNGGYRY